ncbi:hypothetical protein K438DRAFT_1761786 [Mycena galopus ATCC 62051]|nr:hypothetical protein K438DRAFT_1761786 [Mycena galopus ATCC 62051]
MGSSSGTEYDSAGGGRSAVDMIRKPHIRLEMVSSRKCRSRDAEFGRAGSKSRRSSLLPKGKRVVEERGRPIIAEPDSRFDPLSGLLSSISHANCFCLRIGQATGSETRPARLGRSKDQDRSLRLRHRLPWAVAQFLYRGSQRCADFSQHRILVCLAQIEEYFGPSPSVVIELGLPFVCMATTLLTQIRRRPSHPQAALAGSLVMDPTEPKFLKEDMILHRDKMHSVPRWSLKHRRRIVCSMPSRPVVLHCDCNYVYPHFVPSPASSFIIHYGTQGARQLEVRNSHWSVEVAARSIAATVAVRPARSDRRHHSFVEEISNAEHDASQLSRADLAPRAVFERHTRTVTLLGVPVRLFCGARSERVLALAGSLPDALPPTPRFASPLPPWAMGFHARAQGGYTPKVRNTQIRANIMQEISRATRCAQRDNSTRRRLYSL